MAGEPLEDEGFSDDYDDRTWAPSTNRKSTASTITSAALMYGGDDDPCPFDDANHGVSATRRRSYRGGDGQYVEYSSDEYRDQFSKDEDDRDLAVICTLSPPAR